MLQDCEGDCRIAVAMLFCVMLKGRCPVGIPGSSNSNAVVEASFYFSHLGLFAQYACGLVDHVQVITSSWGRTGFTFLCVVLLGQVFFGCCKRGVFHLLTSRAVMLCL